MVATYNETELKPPPPKVLPKPSRLVFNIRELHDEIKQRLPSPSDNFAGHRDVHGDGSQSIVSERGTVRGFRNRVRTGVVTFLDHFSNDKNYRQLEKGKVVMYLTSLSVVRGTYERCKSMRRILVTHMMEFEERDLCMSFENQLELLERLSTDVITVPHLFTNGQHLGDLDTIESMNESGELRRIFKNFQHVTVHSDCDSCGGYGYLPCSMCRGSKRSYRRNNFTEEFSALRCVNCDENGLLKCTACSK